MFSLQQCLASRDIVERVAFVDLCCFFLLFWKWFACMSGILITWANDAQSYFIVQQVTGFERQLSLDTNCNMMWSNMACTRPIFVCLSSLHVLLFISCFEYVGRSTPHCGWLNHACWLRFVSFPVCLVECNGLRVKSLLKSLFNSHVLVWSPMLDSCRYQAQLSPSDRLEHHGSHGNSAGRFYSFRPLENCDFMGI